MIEALVIVGGAASSILIIWLIVQDMIDIWRNND